MDYLKFYNKNSFIKKLKDGDIMEPLTPDISPLSIDIQDPMSDADKLALQYHIDKNSAQQQIDAWGNYEAAKTALDKQSQYVAEENKAIRDKKEAQQAKNLQTLGNVAGGVAKASIGALGAFGGQGGMNGAMAFGNGVNYVSEAIKDPENKQAVTGAVTGIVGGAATAAVNAIDNAVMGDKNFGAQSAAIDTAVHGASSALMKSGNPYAMCCLKDTIVFTSEGKPILIQDLKKEDGILGYYNKQIIAQPIKELFPPLYKESIQIETECGNILRCSIDHPIYSALEGRARYFTVGKKKQRRIKEFSFRRADTLKVGDFVAEAGSIPFFGSQHVKLAYLIGLLIGDGTYGKGHKVPRLFTGDSCTWKWLEENNLGKITAQYYPGEKYSKEFREYSFHGLQSLLRECGIYGQAGKDKRLPINLCKWDKDSCSALLAGLFDTDGFVECNSRQHAGVSLSQSNIELLKQIKLLLLKFGIHCTIQAHPAKNKCINGRLVHSGETYVLNIKTRESVINFYNNITLNIDYKQDRLQKAYLLKLDTKARDTSLEFYNVVADKIKRITYLGFCEVYNLCAGISHTYLAEGIVTHNTAGAALEVANFLTKAGGQTVQGFDVDIKSSGYGNLGHRDSSSSRDFGALIGLGGLNAGKIERKLKERNQQAQMALKASNIADTIEFEQEARMNSVDDVIQQNEIALQGGIDTSLLAAKQGAKLERKITWDDILIDIKPEVIKAQNGAKLEEIPVSEEKNVIPEGALHKNKNGLDLEITKKGIPVITVKDDSAETFEDIKEQENTLVQHAEVEESEIIFNKELTNYIEEARKKWHESEDSELALEVGKRLVKEILTNTDDNTDLITKMEEQV